MPVGSNREVKVDVRIIAASHKPFEEMIKDGTFREDLFYRLNVLPVYLPPLRDRKTDIPHLVNHYINYFNNVHNLKVKGAEQDAMDALTNYSWPGNIRELINRVDRAVAMGDGRVLSEAELFPEGLARTDTKSGVVQDTNATLADVRDAAERAHIKAALARANGSPKEAAEALGVSRTTLWEKMRRLNISPDDN